MRPPPPQLRPPRPHHRQRPRQLGLGRRGQPVPGLRDRRGRERVRASAIAPVVAAVKGQLGTLPARQQSVPDGAPGASWPRELCARHGPGQGLLLQQRHRGQRGRHQVRPPPLAGKGQGRARSKSSPSRPPSTAAPTPPWPPPARTRSARVSDRCRKASASCP